MYPLSFSVHFSFTHWSSCRVSVQPYHLFLTSHVPPGSEGVLNRRLTKPWTWLWGILHSRPPGPRSSRPTDESWGLALCPLTIEPLCPEIPAQGSSRRGHRVRVNCVSQFGVKLTLCLATSTPLVVPPACVGSPSQCPRSLWEGLGLFPRLFAVVLQRPSPRDLPHPCSSVADLRTGSGPNLGEGS